VPGSRFGLEFFLADRTNGRAYTRLSVRNALWLNGAS